MRDCSAPQSSEANVEFYDICTGQVSRARAIHGIANYHRLRTMQIAEVAGARSDGESMRQSAFEHDSARYTGQHAAIERRCHPAAIEQQPEVALRGFQQRAIVAEHDAIVGTASARF
jgi:hypothetical protein